MIKNYHDLIVWQKANHLANRIFDATQAFPKEYLFDLTNQLRRAALYVPTNIAEGCASFHNKELLQFLNIAWRSQSETSYLLEFAVGRGLIGSGEMVEACNEIGRMLNALIASLHRPKESAR